MVPKTEKYIKIFYALSLESAGLKNAVAKIDDLLDPAKEKKFAEYFPQSRHFAIFCEAFALTRFDMMEQLEWDFDVGVMDRDPQHTQEIRDYFETTWTPAIMAPESGEPSG